MSLADVGILLALVGCARVVWDTIGYCTHYIERWRLKKFIRAMKGSAAVLRYGPEPEK